MVAPSKKLLRKTVPLRQMLARAMVEIAEKYGENRAEQASEDARAGGRELMAMLLISGVDLESALDVFDRVAVAGALQINDINLNTIQWDKIDDEDKEALFAEYCANFILSSVIRDLSGS